VLGLAVIALYAEMGWDPLVHLFFWLGTTGGFGILVLLAVTSVAVVAYFLRHPAEESAWHRLIAPGLASVVLAVMVWLAVDNYSTLLGVPPGSPAARWLPTAYALTAAIGVLWALLLQMSRPEIYRAIGRGANVAADHDRPLATPDPFWQGVEL
jgi:hypothetical protein